MEKLKKNLFSSTPSIVKKGIVAMLCMVMVGLFFVAGCKKDDKGKSSDPELGYPTITQNKIWHIERGGPCLEGDGAGCFCYDGLETIKVGGTKTFNGKEYYELLTDNVNQQWQVITYVREEGKKVFFYVEDDDEEYLMYDYDLNVGDEVVSKFLLNPHLIITDTFKVTAIDSIEYNGIKRKRLRLENLITIYRYDYWVEGIGCMRGITYMASAHIGGAVMQLKDCYESDELIFVNENPEFCWVTME